MQVVHKPAGGRSEGVREHGKEDVFVLSEG
jgi:hypothetical protein